MSTPTQTNYDFGNALFYFFKVFGSRPAGALWIMFWNGLLYFLLFAVIVWSLWPFYAQMFTLALSDAEPEAADVFTTLFSVMGGFIIAFFGSILIALMAQGAWLRLLARREIAPLIPIRLGGDEFRLLGVNLLFLVFGGIAYALFVGVVALSVLVVFAGNDSAAAGAAGGLFAFVAFLLVLAVTIFFAIKFSTAPALSVLDRRFRFFDAWPATRNIFWWAFLTYLAMGMFIFVVAMVAGSIAQMFFIPAVIPIFAEFANYSQTHTGEPSPQEVLDILWSGVTHPVAITFILLGTVMSLFVQTFYEGMWHSVGAYLARRYRGLEDNPAAPVAPAANMGDAGGDSGSPAG